MAKDNLTESPLWQRFQKEAKQRRRNPIRLLTNYMRECLEIWEDEKLFRDMQRDARKSGHQEGDAVELAREARLRPGHADT